MSSRRRGRVEPRPVTAADGESRPRWRSGRNFAILPADDAASRSLAAIVAILAFLAALAAGGAEIVAESSADWRASISREATIQVRPEPGRDIEADVARAVDLARAVPGIAQVDPLSRAESEQLLEPWLGTGLDLSDLPVPRLVAIRIERGRPPDMAALRASLAAELPDASLDDHAAWLARLSIMAGTVVGVAVGLVALVLLASGLAVAFATRGAMAGSRDAVEVLHVVGATDSFIAREFAMRFARLGFKGGLIGALAAALFITACGVLFSSAVSGPAGSQIEALFGSFAVGWPGYLAILAIPLANGAIAGLASRAAVKRFLKNSF